MTEGVVVSELLGTARRDEQLAREPISCRHIPQDYPPLGSLKSALLTCLNVCCLFPIVNLMLMMMVGLDRMKA